jgi:trehalose-phosphatase
MQCWSAEDGAMTEQIIPHSPRSGGRRPPSALAHLDEILDQGRDGFAVFLDYDGTLTPIVSRPEQAELTPEMRETLRQLARRCDTAIISGRDLDDVRRRVGLEQLVYAGSHGLDIRLADGERLAADRAEDCLPALARAERVLQRGLQQVPGAIIERKRFAIAAHYRLVADADVPAVERVVDEALSTGRGLRKRGGKRVFELLPDIQWDKGAALRWLMQALPRHQRQPLPIYIGDDLTDEDAFRVLDASGIGIAVMEGPYPTAARYSLRDPEEVGVFLERLAEALE